MFSMRKGRPDRSTRAGLRLALPPRHHFEDYDAVRAEVDAVPVRAFFAVGGNWGPLWAEAGPEFLASFENVGAFVLESREGEAERVWVEDDSAFRMVLGVGVQGNLYFPVSERIGIDVGAGIDVTLPIAMSKTFSNVDRDRDPEEVLKPSIFQGFVSFGPTLSFP